VVWCGFEFLYCISITCGVALWRNKPIGYAISAAYNIIGRQQKFQLLPDDEWTDRALLFIRSSATERERERERESYKVVVDRRLLKSVPLVSAEGPLHSENYCYHEAVHQFTSAYSARQHLPSADE